MRYIIAIIFFTLSLSLNAEIHREATVCEESGELCFYWWPVLPKIEGWEQDKDNSYYYSMNTQAPKGFNFGNAESVIYAKAIYKLRQPDSKNLDEFIKNDKESFLQRDPTLEIKQTKNLKSSNQHVFKSYSFKPQKEGNWEQVSYSEEKDADGNDYYLVFVLSSRNESGYKNSMIAYEQFITKYK